MAKLTLNDIASLANTQSAKQALNENFAAIEAALEDTLSRSGATPNQMEADIDLNSNDLLNVNIIDASQYLLDGVPLSQSVAYSAKAYETFSGTGAQTEFLLARHPGSLGNLEISIDGVVQRPGLDFNFSGTTLIFAVAPPSGTDNILVRYDEALPVGVDSADNILYIPPSTLESGPLKSFLDDLWIPGTTPDADYTGSDLIAFHDPLTSNPAYLKTVSDILAGQEVEIDRFLEKSKIAAIRANTSTVDLTANFQEAFDAFAPTGQGSLFCPRGQYTLDDEVVLAFNGAVRGAGMGATRFRLTNANAHGFRVAYSGLVNFHDFDIVAGVTKTSGAGIRYEGLGGVSGQLCRITNVRAMEQFIGFDMANAGYWHIEGCGIFDPVQFGIYVDNTMNYDAGDNIIHSTTIQKTLLTSGTAGVMQVASGGTKMSDCKILGFDRGYALIPRVGALSVIDLLLTGNSIEDGNVGILMSTASVGTSIGQIVVSGNQLSNKTNGIVLEGAAAGIVIGPNQIAGNFANHIGIYVGTLNGSPSQVLVTGNQLSGNSSVGSVGIFGGDCANNKYAGNQISGFATQYSNLAGSIIQDAELPFAQLAPMGLVSNGSRVFVTDGTITGAVWHGAIAAAGAGATALRHGGAWVGI